MSHSRPIVLKTSLGPVSVWRREDGSLRVEFTATAPRAEAGSGEVPAALLRRIRQAAEGKSARFDDVPTPKGTPFQQACWNAARRVARGTTISYAQLAAAAGRPGAARAAGQAMRRNPMPLVVPCHRVVASNGGLGGFAGTDRATDARCRRKLALLQAEGSR